MNDIVWLQKHCDILTRQNTALVKLLIEAQGRADPERLEEAVGRLEAQMEGKFDEIEMRLAHLAPSRHEPLQPLYTGPSPLKTLQERIEEHKQPPPVDDD